MKPNLKHPARQDEELCLWLIEIEQKDRDEMANGFHYPPPTLWQTFEKHATVIVVSILVGSALLALAAFVRSL